MGSALDEKSLEKAFQGRLDLQGAIRNAAAGMLNITVWPVFYNLRLRALRWISKPYLVLKGAWLILCNSWPTLHRTFQPNLSPRLQPRSFI
jgi:hypothetical protein